MSVSIGFPVNLLLLPMSQIYKAAEEKHNPVRCLAVELYMKLVQQKYEPCALFNGGITILQAPAPLD